tara:strand:- start:395 stop:1060 length:666 start_codon:yes stop_codon:yes gene_type:complete
MLWKLFIKNSYPVKSINTVLFDFDGVLIDSKPAMKIAWESVRQKFKIPNTFLQFEENIGLPFQKILINLSIEEKLIDEITNHYFSKTSQNKDLIKINPHTRYILKWLKTEKILTGIVTSKDQLRTKELVEKFNINVDVIVTPELTKRGKPYSDPIVYATKILNTDIRKSLFIGDMKSDMDCAKNSGCKYLHYINGYGIDNMISYGGVIDSIFEIKEYIFNI